MQIDTDATRAMQATALRERRGPWARLLDSLIALSGGHAQLLRHAERPWSSATFAGTRHSVALLFEGEAAMARAEHFIEALPEHEFEIVGQLVADAAVIEVKLDMLPSPRFEIEVELLLLEDV